SPRSPRPPVIYTGDWTPPSASVRAPRDDNSVRDPEVARDLGHAPAGPPASRSSTRRRNSYGYPFGWALSRESAAEDPSIPTPLNRGRPTRRDVRKLPSAARIRIRAPGQPDALGRVGQTRRLPDGSRMRSVGGFGNGPSLAAVNRGGDRRAAPGASDAERPGAHIRAADR